MEQRLQCNECSNIYADLCNQLLTSFEDTYLSPFKHVFTGYSVMMTLLLLVHIYYHHARILATDLLFNDTKLW